MGSYLAVIYNKVLNGPNIGRSMYERLKTFEWKVNVAQGETAHEGVPIH